MYCCAISTFRRKSKSRLLTAALPYFRRWRSVKLVRDAFLNKLPFYYIYLQLCMIVIIPIYIIFPLTELF